MQRGGVSSSNQSRGPPSSNSASSAAPPSSNSQSNDISDDSVVLESEAADVLEPLQSSVLAASGSGKCAAVNNEIESLGEQLQHVLIQELDTTTSELGSGSSCGDGEGQPKSFEELSESSSRLPRISQQKGPSCNLSGSMPLAAPTVFNPCSGVMQQPVTTPPSSSDTLVPVSRTSHEENDVGRVSTDPVGCSIPLAPPPPSMPVSSRGRSGWVGCSALNANNRGGPTSRRKSIALKGTRSSPNSSRPTSPRSYGEGDGYNSADEQSPWTPGPSGYKDGVSSSPEPPYQLCSLLG